ncbi:TonB-dependent receptor [Polymorphobacter sp.]|uniref:TonB-dependent receptor n=1 Tax=Polymorphobacter sp. TaxID=1909290 RepID=UPI003F718773
MIHITKSMLCLGVAAAALSAATVQAQEVAQAEVNTGGLDEIIVTAQRRSESIQDVPIAITAISAETLRSGQVRGIGEVIALTPNISFQSNGSRDRKDLAIRGISNQLNPTSDVRQTSTPFYIDEFNVVAGTTNPQIVDLERVEVLRGPQGTYFGRNSIGGAINVITKKPVDRFEGEVELGYSSFDTKRAMGVLNVPIVPGLLAIRASGQYEKTDGNIKNINPIGGGNDGEFWTGRVQARLTPNDRLTWDFTYSYSDERLGMRDGVPTGYVTNTWNSVYYLSRGLPSTNPLNPDIGIKSTDRDGVGFFPDNNNRVNFNRAQQVGSTYQFASTRFEWDFDDVTMTGVLGHLKSDVVNFGDVDGGSKDFFYEDFTLTRKSTSGEIRLASNGTRFFNWNLGFFMGRDTGITNQSTFHGNESPLCPGTTPGRTCPGLEATGLDSDSSTKYLAMFGETSFNLSDQFQVILGLRYSFEKTFNVSQTRSNRNVTGTNNRNAPFEDVSPKVTIRYKPSDDLMFYATAARGFKAGGTQTSGSALLSNDFQPETIWNYEVGTKFSMFDNRLRFDVSAFYMDWKDVQQTIRFQFVNPADNAILSVSGVANAGAAESYGVEASFDASVSDNLTLSGFVGFNENKWKDFRNALVEGVILDVTGQRLVNAPRWTAGAQGQFTQPINDTAGVFARAEYQFRGETLATPFAYRYPTYPFIAPSYHNVNLRAGVDVGQFRATVFVENLFNARYFNNAYEKAFYSGVQVEPSLQRIGGSIGYKF